MNPQDFAKKVKDKYPQYRNMDDVELTRRIVAKYPQYASTVNLNAQAPQATLSAQPKSFLEKAEGVGAKVTNALGGRAVAETFGAELAKIGASPEERRLIEQPGVKETAGSGLALGSLFTPVGRIASGVAKGVRALGVGAKTARTAGSVAAGGTAGAAADTGFAMSEGEAPGLGLGTLLGAGIPAGSPLLGALTRVSSKLVGRAGSEIQGALTGTSAETIEQAFTAARTGGKDLEQYTSALRGKITPEALVTSVRDNVDTVAARNQQAFRETLRELGDTPVSTQPAKDSMATELQNAGIGVDENGLLDFSNSKLRNVPNAKAKLQQAWMEVLNMPDTMSLVQLDTTRQAIKAIKAISGDEPSANLANKLIDDAVRSVRGAGEQVPGYGQMLDNFGETQTFLDELERGLSTGDKATIDQTYRRMATALKTNNEQRMALVRELDQATDGAILSTIAGQQLSEALPRGIFRQISAGIAGGAILTGSLSTNLIPALVFASPRVSGEFVRALGIAANKADIIIKAIDDARDVLIKAGAIGGASQD